MNNIEDFKTNINIKNVNINEQELNKIIKIVYNNFGIKLASKKKPLIESRLSSLLKEKGFRNFTEYIKYIENSKNKIPLIELIDKISTNHTYFFRESNHFEFLEKKILPEIFERSKKTKESEIRVWSAGCSSGEETYTISMIINEYLESNKIFTKIKILATDISITVLNKAQKGIYENSKIKNLPKYLKTKYLKELNHDEFEVKNVLKKMVYFKKLNLVDNIFPFQKKFDLIFCRNVMIYFDETTRNKLIEKFSKHLKTDSYFLIGHSETIRDNKNFVHIIPSIYKLSKKI